ncbi:MAG: phosphotransferase family protein [Actinobacteria bacterium]|nr:MAG: phosphotransferase family protein [Actinomycetota bacterium]
MPVADTAPIRPEESFDEQRVAAHLRRALPEFFADEPIEFEQFPGGAANLTYLARTGSTELVLRRAPLGPVAQGAHDMTREYGVLARMWREFPKAPRAYHFCEDPEVMGKPFFVMERRHGYVVRDAWPPPFAADPSLKRRAAGELVDTLGELHRIDPEAVDLGGLGRPDGFVERQVDGWMRRWEAAQTRDVPDMAAAAALLRAGVPEPQAIAVLHNDYKLDNTMISGGGDMVAVFDWDMATRGDPLVDLGTLLAYWSDPDAPTYPVFGERAVTLAPHMAKDEVLERYAAATGFDVAGIRYYEGLAYYRIAVIIEQIYARFVRGQTGDLRFARFEPLAPILAAAAAAVLTT